MMLQEEWGELITEPPVTLTPQKETQLLSQYAFLVNRAAAHMRTQVGVIVDNDDIYQIGIIALLSSIRRYGRDLDEKFAAFAFKRIRGECIVEGMDSIISVGSSRRKAEQKAAEKALKILKNES